MYVLLIIDAASDIPGVDRIEGPFPTWARARERQDILRSESSDPELIQTAYLERV